MFSICMLIYDYILILNAEACNVYTSIPEYSLLNFPSLLDVSSSKEPTVASQSADSGIDTFNADT